MKRLPETRKPAVVATTGFQRSEIAGANSYLEPSPDRRTLQAKAIHRRFAVTWPVAIVIAELHYGGAA